MSTRSRIKPGNFLKQAVGALRQDWPTSSNFLRYQFAKETFNLRHPFGAPEGRGERLRQISLRITDMCNLRCHSCGQWGDNGYQVGKSLKELKRNEVPVDVYRNLVDQCVDEGLHPVWYIWGGEPMMYPGIIDLLYYMKENGMPVTLVSNGTGVAKNARELVETCKVIWLSLDGPDSEIHNTQRPGVSKKHDNFRDVVSALEALHAEKERTGKVFPVIAPISCITSFNADYVTDIYKLANPYSNMHILYLTWWIDPDSAREHTADFEERFGFKPETHYGWIGTWKDFDHSIIIRRFQEMKELSRETGRCTPIMMPHLDEAEQVRQYYSDHTTDFGYNQCVSIFMAMEIDSNGDVSLCRDYHDFVIGNIKSDRLLDMWNNSKALEFRSSIAQRGQMPVCRRCCGLMGF